MTGRVVLERLALTMIARYSRDAADNSLEDPMSLTITLAPEEEARLARRASAAGQDLPTYVSGLVSQLATGSTSLEELSGPIHQNFLESGMTDDELGDLLETAKHRMRSDRHGTAGHE